MNYGIIKLPLVPGRAEPSDKSEMITQYTYGEPYTVLESTAKWKLIESAVDGYQSWIDGKQHSDYSKEDFGSFELQKAGVNLEVLHSLERADGSKMLIPMGSFITTGELSKNTDIKTIATRLLNAPYLWGGKSILGIDCSGFTQIVFRCLGINIPRDAYQQAELGKTIDFIDLAETGDLVFFDNSEGRITHVGIVYEKGKIIHASGKVRIDTIDHEGIYNAEEKKYTHKTRIIKRLST
jgi:hypothetical protein